MSGTFRNSLTNALSAVRARPLATIGGAAAGVAAAADAASLYNRRESFVGQFQNFMFPRDLVDPNQRRNAYISMRFEKYVRRSIYQQPFYTPEAGIRLPIPARLQDSIGVEYDTSSSLGTAVGAVADAIQNVPNIASNILSGNISGAAETAVRSGISVFAGFGATNIDRAASNAAGIFRAAGAQVSGEQVRAGFESLTGVTTNPFQVVLFKSPKFKSHNFSWKLVPKNRAETEELEDIISLFKYHMLPSVSTGGIFFGYPEILQIRLYPRDSYLYKFKPCVVDSVSVNYAPNGPSFYRETGAPTAVEFTVSLQEIEIWTKADYLRDENGGATAVTGASPSTTIAAEVERQQQELAALEAAARARGA